MSISRREFLSKTALATVAISTVPVMSKSFFSNEIVNIGIVGTGDRGADLVNIVSKVPEVRIMACCDILPNHLQNGLKEDDDFKSFIK